MQNEDLTRYVAAFVDELARTGVKEVVVSPGSRSTPLAIMLSEHPDVQVWINIDERSAAYFALGIAKASKNPVGLLCTSGTAAANYFPAIVEANLSRVPLIVLTSDRPHELRDTGAPQAIDQLDLYGKHVKWFVEMAVPEQDIQMLRYARTIANRAVSIALNAAKGPVHLNLPFREPLVPNLDLPNIWGSEREGGLRHIEIVNGVRQLEDSGINYLRSVLHSSQKAIIIAGPLDDENEATAIVDFSKELGLPLLADPLSQIRGGYDNSSIIDCYDGFLKDEDIAGYLTPDLIVRFGAMPVSKSLLLYIKKHHNVKQVIVDEGAGWREPTLLASDMVYANTHLLCRQLLEKGIRKKDPAWENSWRTINKSAVDYMSSNLPDKELFEGKVISTIMEMVPNDTTLFVGNSMPIRDVDTFYFTNPNKSITLYANRGANGIDGIVSTALGISTNKDKVVLLLGDLSFFHDLNGLLAAKQYDLDLTIVVINNNGGGIFSFLPQSKMDKHFETLFGTPTNLDFEFIVSMYGGTFSRITDWKQFQTKLDEGVHGKGLHVIEVPTNRETNHLMHRKLWSGMLKEIKEKLGE